MGKIISIMNRKGGVGKTTTAVALADTLVSEFEAKVIVVDLDPQASASIALAGRERFLKRSENEHNVCGLLKASLVDPLSDIAPYMIGQVNPMLHRDHVDLAVITNSEALWNLELDMAHAKRSHDLQDALARRLHELKERYQYIIVDSPPGQSRTAETALRESDIVICPTVPDRVSAWGLDSFASYIAKFMNLTDKPIYFVVTRYQTKLTEHQQVLGELQQRPRDRISLLESRVAGRNPVPILVYENTKFVRRLGVQKPTTHRRLYGDRSATQLIEVVQAIRRELGEDA